jgi:lipopolysaccharide export system permease protein
VKLIDKYLLRTLFVPLAYCLLAFVMVSVIFDLFDNLPDFIEGHTPILQVVRFYVYFLPSVLILIAPVALMLAVLYALSGLTKNNELTAMRASGISLLRLMLPVIGVGVVFSLAVAAVHETLAPWSAYWTDQFVRAQRQGEMSVSMSRNLAFKNELARRIWMIGDFHTRTFDMANVNVIQQREDGSDESRMQARESHWLDNRWWFIEVITQRYDPKGNPMGPPRFEHRREMTELTERPTDFVNEIKDPEFLSSFEILSFLRTHRNLSRETIARLRVDLHNRMAMPWMCLIVTLIGIPFGAQTGRKGAFLGAILAISLFFGFYVLVNVGLALGKKQMMLPWLAGWLPNLFFLGVGAILVYRMR